MMIIAQIIICIIQGIYIRPNMQNFNVYSINILAFFMPFLLSIASTLGLGLLFSYNKKLIISGLGFSLFINAYILQYYPLINALWSKTHIFRTEEHDH